MRPTGPRDNAPDPPFEGNRQLDHGLKSASRQPTKAPDGRPQRGRLAGGPVAADRRSGAPGRRFLELDDNVPIRTRVEPYPLERANDALFALRHGKIQGAAGLIPG